MFHLGYMQIIPMYLIHSVTLVFQEYWLSQEEKKETEAKTWLLIFEFLED